MAHELRLRYVPEVEVRLPRVFHLVLLFTSAPSRVHDCGGLESYSSSRLPRHGVHGLPAHRHEVGVMSILEHGLALANVELDTARSLLLQWRWYRELTGIFALQL